MEKYVNGWWYYRGGSLGSARLYQKAVGDIAVTLLNILGSRKVFLCTVAVAGLWFTNGRLSYVQGWKDSAAVHKPVTPESQLTPEFQHAMGTVQRILEGNSYGITATPAH